MVRRFRVLDELGTSPAPCSAENFGHDVALRKFRAEPLPFFLVNHMADQTFAYALQLLLIYFTDLALIFEKPTF